MTVRTTTGVRAKYVRQRTNKYAESLYQHPACISLGVGAYDWVLSKQSDVSDIMLLSGSLAAAGDC